MATTVAFYFCFAVVKRARFNHSHFIKLYLKYFPNIKLIMRLIQRQSWLAQNRRHIWHSDIELLSVVNNLPIFPTISGMCHRYRLRSETGWAEFDYFPCYFKMVAQSSRFPTAGQGERSLWERDCVVNRSYRKWSERKVDLFPARKESAQLQALLQT